MVEDSIFSNYKNMVKVPKRATSWGSLSETQRQINHKYRQSILKKLDDPERYRKLSRVDKVLGKHQWVINLFSVSDLESLESSSDESILEYVETFFTKDQHSEFFKVLDETINNFSVESIDKGYLDLLKMMRKILLDDFNNYKVLMSAAMSILEYKFCQKIGVLNDRNSGVSKEVKCISKKVPKNFKLDNIIINSVLTVMKKFYGRVCFEDGIYNVKFGRHSVQHGRLSPEKYTEVYFIKTILLIDAIAETDFKAIKIYS